MNISSPRSVVAPEPLEWDMQQPLVFFKRAPSRTRMLCGNPLLGRKTSPFMIHSHTKSFQSRESGRGLRLFGIETVENQPIAI